MRQLLARERSRPSNYPVGALVLLCSGALFADSFTTSRNFPLWPARCIPLACFAAAIAMFIQGIRVRRSLQQMPYAHCGVCGYNLAGNRSGRCPECGTPIPKSDMQMESTPPNT